MKCGILMTVRIVLEGLDSSIYYYDRENAKDLCESLKDYPEIVFEGHSTDYQSRKCLKEMVEDGIAILKVGPALTFGLRESLFALSRVEEELISEEKRARFEDVLIDAMLEEPKNWKKHYHGSEGEIAFARKYSYSDRCRYYIGDEKVQGAIDKMIENLSGIEIPMNIIHQYLPKQYDKIVNGELEKTPVAMIKDGVVQYMEDYEYAAY